MSELNEDFQRVAEDINAKLGEAAEALKEAHRLANDAGLDGLIFTQFSKDDIRRCNQYAEPPLDKFELNEKIAQEEQKYELIDVSALEAALGNAGWSTSSSYC